MRQSVKPLIVAVPVVLLIGLLALPAVSSDPPANVTANALDEPPLQPVVAPPDCPGQSWRAIRLNCKKGWQGDAVGMYGGTGFAVSCDGDRTLSTICTDFGNNSYSIRMGVQSPGGLIGDCGYNGDKVEVSEKCGEVQLTIN